MRLLYVAFGVIVFVAFLLAAIEQGSKTSATTPDAPQDTAVLARTLRAAHGIQVIRQRLRDPDSITLDSAFAVDDGSLCYQFRAHNGFGGVNRGYAIEMPSGAMLINDDDDNGPDHSAVIAWNKHCAHKHGDSLMARDN